MRLLAIVLDLSLVLEMVLPAIDRARRAARTLGSLARTRYPPTGASSSESEGSMTSIGVLGTYRDGLGGIRLALIVATGAEVGETGERDGEPGDMGRGRPLASTT